VSNTGTAFQSGASTWNLSGLALPDRWILSRHNRLISEVTRLMNDYNFGEAGRQLYDFFWSEFADWYIEIARIRLYGADARAQATARRVLVYVLEHVLRLLHPFIPFVTEAAWQHLPHKGASLMVINWPRERQSDIDEKSEAQMALLIEIIRAIRNIRSEYGVEPAKKISAYIAAGANTDLVSKHQEILVALARLEKDELHIAESLAEKPAQTIAQVISGGIEIYLPLAGMIDLDAERERWHKEVAQLEKRIAASRIKLNNPNFIEKAPASVVEKEREQLVDLELQAAKIWERLKGLG
ncbi:MAG: class I tRNA ligase family protein, partial [Chloroflexi bacterium]|nr:class I tRNA ligase family protein [Chloroflexota bacterium]